MFSSKLRLNWIIYPKPFIFFGTTIETLISLHICMEGALSAVLIRQEQKENSAFKLRSKLFLPLWIEQEDSYSLADMLGTILWDNLRSKGFCEVVSKINVWPYPNCAHTQWILGDNKQIISVRFKNQQCHIRWHFYPLHWGWSLLSQVKGREEMALICTRTSSG